MKNVKFETLKVAKKFKIYASEGIRVKPQGWKFDYKLCAGSQNFKIDSF